MIELLTAYLLWEGGAGAEWWTGFALLILYRVYQYWSFRRALHSLTKNITETIEELEK
jgi:hypothetical protein